MNEQTLDGNKVYDTAKNNIGNNLCSNKVLGCAETVNKIFEMALGDPIGGDSSTQAMMPFLLNRNCFMEVFLGDQLPGDIIISPTGSGDGTLEHGHVGIIAIYGILSNSSSDGRLHENYDVETWNNYYHIYGHFPVRFFRVL